MKSVVRVYFRARFDPASVCVVCARVRARDCSKMTTRADNKKEFPLCFYYQTLNFFRAFKFFVLYYNLSLAVFSFYYYMCVLPGTLFYFLALIRSLASSFSSFPLRFYSVFVETRLFAKFFVAVFAQSFGGYSTDVPRG